MPCFSPLKVYRSREVGKNGKLGISFHIRSGFFDRPMKIPCGQCIGCRLEKSRQWAIRCMNEASLYDENCFITLTYSDENLPKNSSLLKRDFQLFMKRLRKEFSPKKIRFYSCGEYGEQFSRPHYHACLFGLDFADKIKYKGDMYRSPTLEKLWPYGYSMIGSVTFDSAAYVARYVTKKLTGKMAEKYYTVDKRTGEVLAEKTPEFSLMSRRPGIGAPWLEKWQKEVYSTDSVISRGREMKPPKFYDKKYEIDYPEKMELIKKARRIATRELTDEKLLVKQHNVEAKFRLKNRRYENG